MLSVSEGITVSDPRRSLANSEWGISQIVDRELLVSRANEECASGPIDKLHIAH